MGQQSCPSIPKPMTPSASSESLAWQFWLGMLTQNPHRAWLPSLQTVLAQLVDRTGFDPVTATLGLVGQLSSLLDANGVIDRVTALISPLVALLGPLTGRLSPVLCGLLRVCG